MFNEYPYVNLQDINLDWILKHIKELEINLQDFVKLNTIKYADPIHWNITTQYEANTVVVDPDDGTAYLSLQPVPSGVNINNSDYWTPIFNYGSLITQLKDQLINGNEENNLNASKNYVTGDLIFYLNDLYIATTNIPENTLFIPGTNITPISLETFIHNVVDAAINALSLDIIVKRFSTFNDIDNVKVGDIVVIDSFDGVSHYQFNGVIVDSVGADDIYKPINTDLYFKYTDIDIFHLSTFGIPDVNEFNVIVNNVNVLDCDDMTLTFDNEFDISNKHIIVKNGNFVLNADVHYFLEFIDNDYVGIFNCTFDKADNIFTDYNRLVRFSNTKNAEVFFCSFNNYGTAIHNNLGENFKCEYITLTNACPSFDAHWGYGVDTSASNAILKNITAMNADNTTGRHVIYVNGPQCKSIEIDNVRVKNWHTIPIAIKCSNDPADHSNVSVNNCYFENAMVTDTGGGTNPIGIISVPSDAVNTYVNITNCYFYECLYSAVFVDSSTSIANVSNIIYTCSDTANSMTRKAVFCGGGTANYNNIRIDNWNSNFNFVFWIPSGTVKINDLVVNGSVTSGYIFGGNSSTITLGSINTVIINRQTGSGITYKPLINDLIIGATYSNDGYRVAKSGNVIVLDITGNLTISNQTAGSPIFTVADGYRPRANVELWCGNVLFVINTAGAVYPKTAVTATAFAGSYTYIAAPTNS